MNSFDSDDNDEGGSFLKRNWRAMLVAGLALTGGTLAAVKLSSEGATGTRRVQDLGLVQVQPLPPPKPKDILPRKEEPERILVEEEKPVETPEAADSLPGLPPGGTDPVWGRAGGARKGGAAARKPSLVSTWTPYARQAAERIAEAMRRHDKLKSARMAIEARVWIDPAGRVTRAAIQSTGDSAIDAALQNEVLSGMQLSGPPPTGMVMPVCLKLTARRSD